MHRTTEDFITLMEPHYNSAAQYCRALYANDADAEDGLQDAIVKAMQHFSSLRDELKFKSWFFTIITRTFYKSYSRRSHFFRSFVPLQEGHLAFAEVYNDIQPGERETYLLAALKILNEKERASILLFEIAGLSVEEIMHIQEEKSISAIKSRLSRTRLKLRNAIMTMEKIKTENGDNYDIKIATTGN